MWDVRRADDGGVERMNVELCRGCGMFHEGVGRDGAGIVVECACMACHVGVGCRLSRSEEGMVGEAKAGVLERLACRIAEVGRWCERYAEQSVGEWNG